MTQDTKNLSLDEERGEDSSYSAHDFSREIWTLRKFNVNSEQLWSLNADSVIPFESVCSSSAPQA